jgi:putative ABC transport system permease protein
MYILQNALQNLLRNKGRNLMIGVIIFVIIVSTVTALMINNTAVGVINDYKTRFGSEVTLSADMQKLQEEARKNSNGGPIAIKQPSIPPEQMLSFGESDYLQKSNYTAQTNTNCEQLKAIDEEKGPGGGPMLSSDGPDGTTEKSVGNQYYFKLLANQYDDFTKGLREIENGDFPQNENECMVSTELLENSGLEIGDTITVTGDLRSGSTPEDETYTSISYTLKIVGTYLDATNEYSDGMRENANSNRRNEIFTTLDTLIKPMKDGFDGIQLEATYYLKNPDMLDAFTTEVKAKGLSDVFNVQTDESSYDKVVGPVEGLKGISIAFCIIVLAFGSIIIALLSSIAIRERKYEIGVLRAMGMKKGKVILGLWTEMLVITSLCLAIGLGVGLLVAQPVTNIMLEQQATAAENANSENNALPPGAILSGPGGVQQGESDAEPLKNLDISLDMITLLEIIGIALLLSSLAALIATRKITKYEPIKILMERN